MRLVIDTNVLISYFLKHNSIPGQAVRKGLSVGVLLFTEATFGELIAVIYRDKFDAYTTAKLRKEFLQDMAAIAQSVLVTRPVRACRDPNDDKFLEAAVHGEADFIITGDEDLLVLHPFMAIPILKPMDFIQL